MSIKLAFTGHRDKLADEKELLEAVARFPGVTWCHGGAVGFDRQVADLARRLDIPTEVHLPDYATHGRGAPLVRNRAIVAGAAALIALYDGRDGGGTIFTIHLAREQGIEVVVLQPAQEKALRS